MHVQRAQLNRKQRRVKIAKMHRAELMIQLLSFVINQGKIIDLIIAGDWNKYIISDTIQDFYIKHGLYDIHTYINGFNINQADPMYNIVENASIV